MRISKEQVRTYFMLMAALWVICICAGCSDVDSLFTTAEAVAAGIGVVITAIGAIVPAPVAAAINAGVILVSNALAALKQAYDDYKAEPASATLLGKVQNALAAVQQSLEQLLSAAHVENQTLQSWITKVVNAVAAALDAVAKDIIPVVEEGIDEGRITANRVEQINWRAKEVNAALKASYEASLAELPADAAGKAEADFKHRTRRYVGPVPF